MKKNLLLVFVFISAFGFSQQVLKKITETADYTIVEIYSLRNGTLNTNISGNENFGYTNNNCSIYFKDVTLTGTIIVGNQSVQSPITSHIENFCSTNILLNPHYHFGESGYEYFNFENYIGGGTSVPYPHQFKAKQLYEEGDTNNDGLIDCYKVNTYIPKKLIDGTPIPINLWCVIEGFQPDYFIQVNFNNIVYPRIVFKFNGSTWIEQSNDWTGSNIPMLQNVCNSLSVSENENLKNEISIYPNPTKNFISIQNNENSTENFEYKIVDLTGRNVKSGNSKFNEKINIESLASGNYIIQIETEKGEKFSEKLIKN